MPFGALAGGTATWIWIAISVAFFLVGVAVLPVSRTVRWWIVFLAGWSFPFVYAVKLGQVGPILFGLLALGWRWFDRPAWLGITGALGAAIKIEPGLVLVWAVLTVRWRAAAIGAVTLVVLAVLATLLAGVGAWSDFLTLLRTVSDPITTEHNFTPGAVAFQLGVPADAAALIQLASTVAVVVILIAAVRFATDEASYLMTVVASQLVSPILWITTRCSSSFRSRSSCRPVAGGRPSSRSRRRGLSSVSRRRSIYPIAFWVTLIATSSWGMRPRTRARAWVSGGRHDRAARSGDVGRVRVVALSAVLYWLANRAFDAQRGDFFYLADAFLHGRTWLTLPLGPADVIPVDGRFYVPFAPFPAIVFMPLVLLTGPVRADQIESGSTRSSPPCRSGCAGGPWVGRLSLACRTGHG